MRFFICNIFICLAIAVATTNVCFGDSNAENSAVVQQNLKTSIVFAVVPDANGGDGIRNVLFRLSKAVVQQTGQVVTVEVSEGQTNQQLPLLPQASGSASEWLNKLKHYVPSLIWSSDGRAIHVFLPASRPYDPNGVFVTTSRSYDPLSGAIPVDYSATLTVDQWYTWLVTQAPRSRLYIDASGYGNSPNIGYKYGLSDQKVHLDITKGTTIRQFLTKLASGFGGSWTADIYGPLEPITKAGQSKPALFRQLNTVYLFRPSDPFS